MSQVGIVSDSVTGLSEKTMRENGIHPVSMGFVYNNKVYRDFVDIKMAEFWQLFPTFKEIPTTSACSTGDFRQAYLDLARTTDKIVCITISNKLSATHKAADQAAQIVRSENPKLDIRVIDSLTSSGGLGWTILEAARAARAGKNIDEVVETARQTMQRARYMIVIESMKYILKVARAPGANGQAVPPQICPIMGIVKPDIGVMENIDRAGSVDEAITKAADLVKNYITPGQPVHFILTYPEHQEKSEQMAHLLKQRYNTAEIIYGQWPPSAMVAVGSMWGLGFYS
jgi:DegV family protein with EDD domain